MPNKNYISGRNFEYRVKKRFEKKGFYVFRSAGSKSKIDLIAISWNRVLLIQCKHNSSPFPKDDEIKELLTKLAFPFILAYNEKRKLILNEYKKHNDKLYIHKMEI